MAKLTGEQLLEQFQSMTLLELSQFVKDFEAAFGVSAVPPAAVYPPGDLIPHEPAEEPEEQAEFSVILTASGDKKIQVIKEVRALAKLGLKEAKDLVDAAPATVLSRVSREDADKARALIAAAGGTAELR